MSRTWIVVEARVAGNPESGYGVAYNWDREERSSKKAAIRHGFRTVGSDDFNIACLRDGKLESFWWMDEIRNEAGELRAVADSFDLQIFQVAA